MKWPAWTQLPLVLALGFTCAVLFQNFSNATPIEMAPPLPQHEQAIVASSVDASRLPAGESKGSVCRITTLSCPKHREFTGVRYDTYQDAHIIPLRCLERAKQYAALCETEQPVRAEFLKNGIVRNQTQYNSAHL